MKHRTEIYTVDGRMSITAASAGFEKNILPSLPKGSSLESVTYDSKKNQMVAKVKVAGPPVPLDGPPLDGPVDGPPADIDGPPVGGPPHRKHDKEDEILELLHKVLKAVGGDHGEPDGDEDGAVADVEIPGEAPDLPPVPEPKPAGQAIASLDAALINAVKTRKSFTLEKAACKNMTDQQIIAELSPTLASLRGRVMRIARSQDNDTALIAISRS